MSAVIHPVQTVSASARQVVAWLGLRLEVPASWEIIRHGIAPRKGSLAFADRRRQRLQVTWTRCVKRPDLARLLSDHRARQKALDPAAVFVVPTLPIGWRGLSRPFAEPLETVSEATPATTLWRAVRYDDATDRLLEVVLDLETDSRTDLDGARRVLESLRVTGPAEDATCLRAFGVEATFPKAWRLHRTRVLPADVTLVFVPRDARRPSEPHRPLPRCVTLRRRGLAAAWFRNDWAGLFRADAPKARIDLTQDQATASAAGHTAATATWDVPGPRGRRLLGLHQAATSRAWHCAKQQAVYQMTAVGPIRNPPTLAGFTWSGGETEARCGCD